MSRFGVVFVVALAVASCTGSAGSSATNPATSLSETTSTTTMVTSTSAVTTTGAPEVWRDSDCLQRFDPPRASPPDGYVPHLICGDDPTRIAPVARGFRDPMPAIDAVLDGPVEEESEVGFEEVGTVDGYDLTEDAQTIEVTFVGPASPRLVAAVRATLEWGTTKDVVIR